jgi:putative SOS response-associated peptidase YedK
MCGAYGYTKKDIEDASKLFKVQNSLDDLETRYNVRPTQKSPVLFMSADGIQIKYMFWSFIPSWAKDTRLKFSTFNARDDHLLESKLYKNAVTDQRCVVLASFFYEPDKINFVKPPHPWHLFRHKDKTVMAFAGLYNVWKDPKTNEELYTFTIITTTPNTVVGKYHERQPVQLNFDGVLEWLNPDLVEPEQVIKLLKPIDEKEMEEWHVADEAKNPRNDNPDLIKQV